MVSTRGIVTKPTVAELKNVAWVTERSGGIQLGCQPQNGGSLGIRSLGTKGDGKQPAAGQRKLPIMIAPLPSLATPGIRGGGRFGVPQNPPQKNKTNTNQNDVTFAPLVKSWIPYQSKGRVLSSAQANGLVYGVSKQLLKSPTDKIQGDEVCCIRQGFFFCKGCGQIAHSEIGYF